jgi:hypothetical protein
MELAEPIVNGKLTVNPSHFKPGNKLGVGRPKGARSRLQENFLVVLAEDFKENGEDAIVKMRQERPSEYVKCIASLMPRQLELDRPLQEMTDDELYAGIAALQRLVDAENARQGSADTAISEPTLLLPSVH